MLKKDLMGKAHINATTKSNMGKCKAVSLETLARICQIFDCKLNDIIDINSEK